MRYEQHFLQATRWESVTAGTARDFGDDRPSGFYAQGDGFVQCRGANMNSDVNVKVTDGGLYNLELAQINDSTNANILVIWND